jgi:predicted HicB family RNase H-like nuclease
MEQTVDDQSIAVINVRLPADLKCRIAVAAARNRRSLNSEIVYQLAAIYAAEAPAGERAA